MLSQTAVRRWSWVHKWTSLASTLFLLMLCITGLPLIFAHELDDALGNGVEVPQLPAGTPRAGLDVAAAAALAQRPESVIQYAWWEADEPDVVGFTLAPSVTAAQGFSTVLVDARTAQVLKVPQDGLVMFLYRLHTDMFAGLPGKLFLGFMGLLLLASLVSGVVVYAPLMRKLRFGTVRAHRSPRTRWLDLHNLLGIATLLWLLVVGATGVINSCAELVFNYWKTDQIGAMAAPYRDRPVVTDPGSLDAAVATARAAAPEMTPLIVAYPGTMVSSHHHYMVFMSGNTPLTSRLGKPLLVDAMTAELTDMRESPWYLIALLGSQPLHFGDYGGLPFKILWAVLDLIAILVLGSGIYLWLARRRAEARTPAWNGDAAAEAGLLTRRSST